MIGFGSIGIDYWILFIIFTSGEKCESVILTILFKKTACMIYAKHYILKGINDDRKQWVVID